MDNGEIWASNRQPLLPWVVALTISLIIVSAGIVLVITL